LKDQDNIGYWALWIICAYLPFLSTVIISVIYVQKVDHWLSNLEILDSQHTTSNIRNVVLV
jgi:hypothetical protein